MTRYSHGYTNKERKILAKLRMLVAIAYSTKAMMPESQWVYADGEIHALRRAIAVLFPGQAIPDGASPLAKAGLDDDIRVPA